MSMIYMHDITIILHNWSLYMGFAYPNLFVSHLTDRTNQVSLSLLCSDFNLVHLGLFQGSERGPVVLSMYVTLRFTIVNSHFTTHHS